MVASVRAADRRIGRVPAAIGLGGIHLPLAVRRHAAGRGQPRHMVAIDLAPDASRPPRRIALQKRLFVERLADAVDPSPAQGDVERLRIGHRRQARTFLVNLQPDLGLARVVRFHPRRERRLRAEALDLLGIRNDRRHEKQFIVVRQGFTSGRRSRMRESWTRLSSAIASLDAAYARHWDLSLLNRSLDTMDLTLHLERAGAFAGRPPIRKFTLDALCEMFGVIPHDRHTASGDAFITAQVFLRLSHLAVRMGRGTLAGVCELFDDSLP